MKKPVLRLVAPTSLFWDSIEASQTKEHWRAGISVPIYSAAGYQAGDLLSLAKGFAMPDVVDFKPVRGRRPHRSVRPKLLNIKGLDRRTAARKAFDALVAEIEHDLGGREQLSAIEKSLIQAYAGSAILLDDLNARVVLGQEIDVGTHAQVTSALVRIASRLGLQRRQRDVTPTVEEYLRSKRQELRS